MRISSLKIQFLLLCALAGSRANSAAVTLTPSGGDDTAAVQAALAAGGAITLSGALRISKTLTPTNGVTISGAAAGSGLLWTGPAGTGNTYAVKFAGTGLTLINLTLNGAGANIDGGTNVGISKCTIENITSGSDGYPFGVYFGSLTGSTIDGNTFIKCTAVGAIMGYDAANSHFDGNTIANCYEGIHLLWSNSSGGCTVSFNDVSGHTRHGLELQGNVQGLTVAGNYVHDAAAAASHINYSIATGGDTTHNTTANGVVIKGNVSTFPIGADNNPQVNYCHIEAMGIGTQVTGNYCYGGGWGGLYADDALSGEATTMAWTGNQYHGIAAGVPATGEGSASYLASVTPVGIASNTSDNVWTGTVPAAVLATVGPAAMNGGGSGAVTGSGQPGTGSTTPSTNPAGALKLTQNGDGSVTIVSPTAVSQVAVSPTTPSSAAPVVTIPVNPASMTVRVANIPASWDIQVAADGLQGTIQVFGGPASVNNGWAAAQPELVSAATQHAVSSSNLPATNPTTAPAPTITEIITTTVYSNGTAIVTTQP